MSPADAGGVEPPPDNVVPPQEITAQQRQDLATLLAKRIAPGNIEWLARRFIDGAKVDDIVRSEVVPIETFAATIVNSLDEAGKLAEAIAALKVESTRNLTVLGETQPRHGRRQALRFQGTAGNGAGAGRSFPRQ